MAVVGIVGAIGFLGTASTAVIKIGAGARLIELWDLFGNVWKGKKSVGVNVKKALVSERSAFASFSCLNPLPTKSCNRQALGVKNLTRSIREVSLTESEMTRIGTQQGCRILGQIVALISS